MSKKKRKNTVVVPLTAVQRLCLWSSLDLLSFVHESDLPNVDFSTVDQLCGVFDQLDSDDRTLDFEFYPKEHRICNIALKFACQYLDELHTSFALPILPKIDQELRENEAAIRSLHGIFGGS